MGASLSQREVLVGDRTIGPRPQAPQIGLLFSVFCILGDCTVGTCSQAPQMLM